MIKRQETGLTEYHYTLVRDNAGLFAAQTLVQQRSLEFTPHSENQPIAGRLFDAAVDRSGFHPHLVKVWLDNGSLLAQRLDSEREADQTWGTPVVLDTGVSAVRPSLTANWVFYVKENAVWRRSHRDPQTPAEIVVAADDYWLQQNQVGSGGEITHIAAAEDECLCFIACYRTDYNTNLIGAKYTGTPWTTFNSDVYWPHKLDGLDAANVGETGYGEYVVVIASDLPPLIGQQADGTKVHRVAERRDGLIAFRVQNNRFSDHYLVEVFDDASDYQFRSEPRLTRLDATTPPRVVLTAYGKDGKASYSHAALHYYFSVDGRLWETDQLVELPSTYNGAVMVEMYPYTYLVAETKTYRSPTTELTGTIHPALVEDITSLVLGYHSDQSGTRQSSFDLKNTGWWDGSLLSKKVQLSLLTRLGIWAEGQKRLVLIAHELIDVVSLSRDKPAERVVVKARDALALISDVVRSPQSREYDTQVVGADKYYDFTGTGYGGLAHTAGVEGTWSTADNWLKLRSSNKRGVAFNTFKTDSLWNGLIEATLQIDKPDEEPASTAEKEFVGLVVRAYDQNNLLAVTYEVHADRLRLVKYVDGKATTLVSVSNMGWDYGEKHYLRVMFRYSKIRVFVSDDGHSWSVKFEHLLKGKEPTSATPTSGNARLTYEDGMVGFTGLGYTKDDQWPDPTDPTPPPGDPGSTNTYGTGTKSGLIALKLLEEWSHRWTMGLIAYTRSCTTGPWVLLHGGIQMASENGQPHEIVGCFLDPYDPGAAYLFFKNGDSYYNPDWRSGAHWELFASGSALQAAYGAAHGGRTFDRVENAVVTMAAEGYCLLTVKGYGFWNCGAEGSGVLIRIRRLQNGIDVSPVMRLTQGNYTDSGLRYPFAHLGCRNGNLVMATGTGYWGREHNGVWVCDWTTTGHNWSCFTTFSDGDATYWSPKFQMPHVDGPQAQTVWSTWKKLDGSDNTGDQQLFWAGPGDRIWKSENGGQTFAVWTGAGVCPAPAEMGPRLDTWEVNIDQAAWVDYQRASGDAKTPDKLYLSDTAGESWRSVMLPVKHWIGWSGGFPSKNGQFYIGASRYGSAAMAWEDGKYLWDNSLTDRDSILLFTKDGGQTWSDWTYNLWTLVHQVSEQSLVAAGVVRFTPHWLEQ